MKRVLTAAPLALLCSSCERRQATPPEAVPQATEASSHEFLSAVINSLSQVENGLVGAREAAGQSSLVELMTVSQNAAIAVRMGANLVKPFEASADSNRRDATSAILASYDMFGRSLAIQLAAYERIDSARTEEDLRGLRRHLSDAKVAYQQGSLLLLDAVTLAVGSTVVGVPGDTSHVALDMSELERLSLVAELDSLMGPQIRTAPEPTGAMAAARLLRRNLDQSWRTAR